MGLWQIDIVDGIVTVDGVEAKVITGVDDHSRFCVIAAVVPRATGRAVSSRRTRANCRDERDSRQLRAAQLAR